MKRLFVIPIAMTLLSVSGLRGAELPVHGFADIRAGTRLQQDSHQDEQTLTEMRLQLDWMQFTDQLTLQLRGDLVYDDVAEDHDIDLETGRGWLDLREANVMFSPLLFMDVKAGRQILTWGVGDLVFINDLFPKDWVSFFSGRDEEYLKAPSDALFLSFFMPVANLDIAYTPRFDADRYITGERISYWNPQLQRRAGQDAVMDPARPDDWFEDDELALRLTRNVQGYELALYGYHGFWKSPAGFDPAEGSPLFPRLNVYGLSGRGRAGSGIFSLEAGLYQSLDDENGRNPFIDNSEVRTLLGYQSELAPDLTATWQYYTEWMLQHDRYQEHFPGKAEMQTDEVRHVLTLRLTQLLLSQTLRMSLFTFYSPSDEDAYMRPYLGYKVTDAVQWTLGANIFFGKHTHTFFDQFADNNNVYTSMRYSF